EREQQKQQAVRSYPHRNRCTTLSRGGSDLDENGGSRFGENQHPHFKMQPHGPQSSLRKVIFVGPTIVRSDKLTF
ncbi:hypothetical protein KDW80_28245, partial [Burkholderia vietnamiensis]|nr:hypothetical protein [Burkholderia vietnamiensis]MCA8395246.1 hypothetical protein [Burkholderia vietnamiensis]